MFPTLFESKSGIFRLIFLFGAFFLSIIFALKANPTQAAAPVPIYRFWSNQNQHHFYTASEEEKNLVIANYTDNEWLYEGIAYYAFLAEENGTTPVHRFWSDQKQSHFYTTSVEEKNYVITNYAGTWKYEGISYYAYTSEQIGTTPIYRFWSNQKQGHFYTINPGEKNCVINNFSSQEWSYEGIAFWVPLNGIILSTDETSCGASSGPEISVGLWKYDKNGIKDSPFKIQANKDYNIKDANGNVVSQVLAQSVTKVTYNNNQLKIYKSIPDTLPGKEVFFDAADGDNSSLIFDVYRPNSSYDQYRGKIKVKYTDDNNIWVINSLPLEQYVWGMGETTGTGPMEHTKVMTAIFRTYGYWYIKYATKYAIYGFKIRSDSGSQIYNGYDWEIKYPNIKTAAGQTRGVIARYNGDVALTPYSSWTDGRTRSFEERWGSKDYPWCQSVPDPYGKHPTKTTVELETAGNHMVGLSANGSLNLANNNIKNYQETLKYYYTGIDLSPAY